MTETEQGAGKFKEFFSRLMKATSESQGSVHEGKNKEKIEQIKKKKEEARKFAEERQKNGQHVTLDPELRNNERYKFERENPKQIQQARQQLEESLQTAKEKPIWLVRSADEIVYSPEAATYASRIASLDPELQNDPIVLYREVAYLSASMRMDMTTKARGEINSMVNKTIDRIMVIRAEQPDKPFPLKHIELKQTLLEQYGAGGLPTPPDIYNKTTDLMVSAGEPKERTNLRRYLERVQNQLTDVYGSPATSDSEAELERLHRFEKELIDGFDDATDPKTGKVIAHIYDRTEAQPYLAKLRARKQPLEDDIKVLRDLRRKEERDQYREEGEFNTISLSRKLMEAMWENDSWKVEQNLRTMELGSPFFPNTPVAKASERELEKMAEYFSNEQYISDLRKHLRTADRYKDWSEPQREEELEKRRKNITRLSEEIHLRITEQIIFGQINLEGDPRKIGTAILQLGSHGIGHLQAGNAGLNEIVGNRLIQKTREARFQPDDKGKIKETAFTSETFGKIRQEMEEEIKKNKELYERRYQNKKMGGWEGKPLDDEAIEAIVHQAEMLLAIEQRDLVAILEAPGPARRRLMGEDTLASSSFQSFSNKEKFLAAMDVARFGFDKWHKLPAYQKKMWRNACEFAAKASGRDYSVVYKKLQGVKQGSDEFKELAEEAFDGVPEMRKIIKLERRAESALEGGVLKKLVPKIPKDFKNLSMDDLQQQMIVREGEKIVTELLESYDNFSSGWRIKEYLKQLERMYGTDGKHLGLGMRLRLEGYDLVHLESREQRKEFEGKVKEQLIEIAKYRPQAIFEWLSGGKDKDAKTWFDGMKKNLTKDKIGQDITHESQLYKFVSERFNLINDFLADEGIGPIDYSDKSGITTEQMEIVKEVCSASGTDADAYLSVMEEISKFVLPTNPDKSQNLKHINKLVEKKYYDIYTRTRWVDDVRMRYLEDPDHAPGSSLAKEFRGEGIGNENKKGITHARLSDLFVEAAGQGMGGGDQLPRSWNDLGTAIEASNVLVQALTPDAKQFMENILKVYEMVGQYSGKDPTAARAVIYMMAGYGKTCKTDDLLDLLMLGKVVEDSSQARRLVGGGGPSLAKGEALKFEEEVQAKVLLEKIESIAPDLAREAEVFMGVRFPGPGKYLPGEWGRHAPVWLHRVEIAAILAGLLILAQSQKVAQEELSGKKQ